MPSISGYIEDTIHVIEYTPNPILIIQANTVTSLPGLSGSILNEESFMHQWPRIAHGQGMVVSVAIVPNTAISFILFQWPSLDASTS